MKKIVFFALMLLSLIAHAQVRNYKNGTRTDIQVAKEKAKPKTTTFVNEEKTSGIPTFKEKAKFVKVPKATKEKKDYFALDAESEKTSKFGIVSGIQFSNINNEEIISQVRSGYYAGVSYNTYFTESVGIEFNINYATMGAIIEDEFELNSTYLQAPILFDATVAKFINFKIGPQIGYLLSSEFDGDDIKQDQKDIDYGLMGGLGVKFKRLNLGVGARVYYGLATTFNTGDKVGNTAYSFGASVTF